MRFRRQFFWGSEKVEGTYWTTSPFGSNSYLSTHQDLQTEIRQEGKRSLAVLGTCFYPLKPHLTAPQVADRLFEKIEDLESLLSGTVPLGGRWAIILWSGPKTFLIHDACGFRSVHYCPGLGCGSDPKLLDHVLNLEADESPELSDFLSDPKYLKRESSWVGDGTVYKNCKRLMPNHYLDLSNYQARRFFPRRPLPKLRQLDEVVPESASILRGSIEALLHRHQLALPLTAGLDSRVLLAASKPYKDRLDYFVDNLGPDSHKRPDIVISKQMSEAFDLRLQVNDLNGKPPDWFLDQIRQNVSRARQLPKTNAIYDRFKKDLVVINGNGSEICRHLYRPLFGSPRFSARKLSHDFAGSKGSVYATRVLEGWLRGLEDICGYNLIDLLYWEQRMGNWGAHFPAEQDVSIEEVSPYNCRQLIEGMLALPRELRAGPDYPHYRKLLKELWPETLDYPINPLRGLPLKAKLRERLRRSVPSLAPVIYR